MKCPKCGNSNIKAGQKFCTNCGQPFLLVLNHHLNLLQKQVRKVLLTT
ncbi:MAG: zinc ribbon domain-containing protein [Prevotellaceae bacterium]|nr:zinc ribbon domain-containing protein [Prevotellaceae bacterium]